MKDRIVWIDWAKAFGIMIVVYCHTPQNDNFVRSFFYTFQMPLFFLLAGYLHKNTDNTISEQIKKYWKSLIIPYLLFQFIFYPYWLKEKHVFVTDWMESVITPFIQCIYGIPINGVMWFVFALLITKIIADIAFKCCFSNYIIMILCSFSIFCAYIIWQDDKTNITFAIDSLFNFFPFFFIGYYLKTYNFIKKEKRMKSFIKACLFFGISALLISINNKNYLFDRISFYILGVSGSLFLINLCKTFTSCPNFIQTVSIGNIIILGLHWMFIGIANSILIKTLHIECSIHYTIPGATILVIAITITNYFIIKLCQKHFKPLLGYR